MISYDECLKEVGHDKLNIVPVTVWEYLAYKNGVVKSFDSEPEAKRFSRLTERRDKNESEVESYWASRQKLEQEAAKIFEARVREDISDFSDDLWNLCWDTAYNDSHSGGYDDVANTALEYVEFAERVIKLSNEEREYKRLARD